MEANPATMKDALRELLAVEELHQRIEVIERDGRENFVDSVPLPLAKDALVERRKAAWATARTLAE